MKRIAVLLTLFAGGVVAALPPIPKAGEAPPARPLAAAHPRGHKTPDAATLAHRHADAFRRHDHRMKWMPTATPAQFDCRTMGWCGPVRDQGQCGTCWDVAGCDCLTSAFIKAGSVKGDGSWELSPQYFLDQCGYQNAGCNGDDSINVLEWAKSTGVPSESDYGPYTATQRRCNLKAGTKLYKIADWGYCTPSQQSGVASVQDIKNAMVQRGPISTAIAADNSWDSIGSNGVLPYRKRTQNDIDHDVQIVGWDDTKQIPGAPAPGAFLGKNQWSAGWGAQGYFWCAYGSHEIGTEAAWVTVATLPPPPTTTTWNCSNGTCVEVQGTDGKYPTQAACVASGCLLPPPPPGPATVTIPDLPVYVGGVHIGHAQGGTFPVTPKSMPVTADKGLSIDLIFALVALARDIEASGNGKLIADFKALMAAIKSRAGILAALELLGTDLVAVGTDPAILQDLLRIAADLGIPVPADSPLKTGKPCCGR